MKGHDRKIDFRAAIFFAALGAVAVCVFLLPSTPVGASREAEPLPTPRTARYTQFAHSTRAHRADCATCHKFPSKNSNKVRPAATAFPDITEYPSHSSCIKCHAQQFFRGARPAICSICHVAASPRNAARHPFPNPREAFDLTAKGKRAVSEFVVGFPHDKHIEIVSAHKSQQLIFVNASLVSRPVSRQEGETSCAVCHQTLTPQGDSDVEYLTKPPTTLGDGFWIKKGMFKSSPLGHASCFTCHSADPGMLPAPNNCAACHQLKPAMPPADLDSILAAAVGVDNMVIMEAWHARDSSGTYRHEFSAHSELSCSTCHNVATMNTAQPETKRVAIASCVMCHATATSDDGGALNFEVDARKANAAFSCSKCHTAFGKLLLPDSHTKAIADAAGK